MRVSIYIIVLLLSVAFISCKDNPVDKYGTTVVDKFKSTEQFADQVSLQNIQQSVTTFRLTNSRFPEDLKELSDFAGTPLDPEKYDYDSSTGKVTAKN
jgi:hypothetical protein